MTSYLKFKTLTGFEEIIFKIKLNDVKATLKVYHDIATKLNDKI